MFCFLMSTKAISQSLVSPSISQLNGFQIQPKIHKELIFREIWATRSFGLDEFEDMMQELAAASVSGWG